MSRKRNAFMSKNELKALRKKQRMINYFREQGIEKIRKEIIDKK